MALPCLSERLGEPVLATGHVEGFDQVGGAARVALGQAAPDRSNALCDQSVDGAALRSGNADGDPGSVQEDGLTRSIDQQADWVAVLPSVAIRHKDIDAGPARGLEAPRRRDIRILGHCGEARIDGAKPIEQMRDLGRVSKGDRDLRAHSIRAAARPPGQAHAEDAVVGLIGSLAQEDGVVGKQAGSGQGLDDAPRERVRSRQASSDQCPDGRGALRARGLDRVKPGDPSRDPRVAGLPNIVAIPLRAVGGAGRRAIAVVVRGSCPSMRWKFGVELERPSVRRPEVELL